MLCHVRKVLCLAHSWVSAHLLLQLMLASGPRLRYLWSHAHRSRLNADSCLTALAGPNLACAIIANIDD